ncbi:hypothetical protein fugu_011246 [Takifugu bimaculatus]|uniref:Uncharacterized protein n=1 Tax=Takifugu bimaculatus TaxID=433685 RepID=A0A4Z2CCI6_9TELE|nr:hypothetical protein fugu_011246 [Takifugu bimaculatus]
MATRPETKHCNTRITEFNLHPKSNQLMNLIQNLRELGIFPVSHCWKFHNALGTERQLLHHTKLNVASCTHVLFLRTSGACGTEHQHIFPSVLIPNQGAHV